MRIKLIFLLCIFIKCETITDEEAFEQWMIYKEKYKKPEFGDPNRIGIFKNNLKKIESHNALYENGKITWKMGINRFTHLTPAEFLNFTGSKTKTKKLKNIPYFERDYTTSNFNFDWRDFGIVSPVKDMLQNKGCQCSWAFSATGAIESQFALKMNKSLILSEQMLLDCDHWKNRQEGCDGGQATLAFLYIRQYGIEEAKDYPEYDAKKHECRQNRTSALRIKDYVNVESENENALMKIVESHGPVSAIMDATENLQNYVEGIFYDPDCTSLNTDVTFHVLIVGFGNQDGLDYWLIKNSWGENWGDRGYFKIMRNMDDLCGIALHPSYPIIHENDPYQN